MRGIRLLQPLVVVATLVFGAVSAQAPAGKGATPARVILSTSEGDITLELDAERAPKTVANFVQYARDGHYDGTVFHRVIDNFMIQGGGFTPDMKQKSTRAAIPLESRNGLKNDRGTIAMARTSDPDSATAQFFINVGSNNDFLNHRKYEKETTVETKSGPRVIPAGTVVDGYAVFGKVVSGMDVVDKIRAAPTQSQGGHQNVPVKPVVIRSAKVLN